MQKQVSILFIIISLSTVALAKVDLAPDASTLSNTPQTGALSKGDSLYAAKQYTQAFEWYHSIYQGGHYTPAMLLKMAHIQEGLNRLGESLFYLNIYFLATDDHQALKKMEELAKKNNLQGYETSESAKILGWFQEQYTPLALAISAVAVFLAALMFYQKSKAQKPAFTGLMLAITLAVLFVHINFTKNASRGIVADPQTYLMSGPSAGSSVVAIIGEGHQLQIEGKKDVWLQVRWGEREVWVKEGTMREIRL